MLVKERAASVMNGIQYSSILTEPFLGCIDKGFGRNTPYCFRLVRQIRVLCNSWMTVSQERFHSSWASPKSDIGREAGPGFWSKWPSNWQPQKSAPRRDFLADPVSPKGVLWDWGVCSGCIYLDFWTVSNNVVNNLAGKLVPAQQKQNK